MKKIFTIGFIAGLWAILFMAGPALAARRVVVLTGDTEANAKAVGNYKYEYEGIREGLKAQGIQPEFQYIKLESLATDAQKKAAADKEIARLRASKPDVIITLNDACLKYVGSRIDNIPVVFAFTWGNPKTLGLPKPNVTGVIRRSYAADIWAMTRKLTGAKTVALISKKSDSMAGVRRYLFAKADKLEAASGVRFKEMYLVDTFAQWANRVKNFPAGFIYLGDTTRVTKDGTEMSPQKLVRWTVDNAKVPVIGADAKSAKYGALFSIVTSEKNNGLMAAQLALKILDGTKPSALPYVTSSKGKLVVNIKTAQKYKIDIPYDILSTAEEIYQ